jgi:hypothetical protein
MSKNENPKKLSPKKEKNKNFEILKKWKKEKTKKKKNRKNKNFEILKNIKNYSFYKIF